MKVLLSFILISSLWLSNAMGQSAFRDDGSLTQEEADFLNTRFQLTRGSFDFTQKRIAFIGGSGGTLIFNKDAYLKLTKEYDGTGNFGGGYIVVLTEKEKALSGGYDAFVTYAVKGITSKRALFRKLNPKKGRTK